MQMMTKLANLKTYFIVYHPSLKRNEKAIERYSWENVSKDWKKVINNVLIS